MCDVLTILAVKGPPAGTHHTVSRERLNNRNNRVGGYECFVARRPVLTFICVFGRHRPVPVERKVDRDIRWALSHTSAGA